MASFSERIDIRVEVKPEIGTHRDYRLRVAEEDGSAVYLMPAELDGEGEHYLGLADFCEAIAALGIDIGDYAKEPRR